MSKLIDKLNQAAHVSPQPMGFGSSRSASPRPGMILIASLNQPDLADLSDYVAGADAGLWRISSGSQLKSFQKAAKAVPGMPWGCVLDIDSEKDLENIIKSADDFIVFPMDMSLALPEDEKLGRVLLIDSSLNAGLLRAIDSLPVNAVLVKSVQENRLTWHDLSFFNLLSGLLSKPLLAITPSTITAGELLSLWKAGVDGIVIDVEVDKPSGKVKELRQIIDGLSYPRSRRRGKVEALLPQMKIDTPVPDDIEEEE